MVRDCKVLVILRFCSGMTELILFSSAQRLNKVLHLMSFLNRVFHNDFPVTTAAQKLCMAFKFIRHEINNHIYKTIKTQTDTQMFKTFPIYEKVVQIII